MRLENNGCWFCDNEHKHYDDSFCIKWIDGDGYIMAATDESDDSQVYEFRTRVHYCPMCGKKLVRG